MCTWQLWKGVLLWKRTIQAHEVFSWEAEVPGKCCELSHLLLSGHTFYDHLERASEKWNSNNVFYYYYYFLLLVWTLSKGIRETSTPESPQLRTHEGVALSVSMNFFLHPCNICYKHALAARIHLESWLLCCSSACKMWVRCTYQVFQRRLSCY